MLAVKNFFLPERTAAAKPPETPQRFSRMPEAFLRSIRRRSLRVKRAKSLVVPDREKRKSVIFFNYAFETFDLPHQQQAAEM
ncbi:unnamed protein product [Ceratitis capitata]|uniref:(Mediterranean fruit fly) hypothetical protein n=1 Tax=Ceratitis capitata TaxID=7213 RepID=A0A811UEZ5_CERCA|nr:unnamed protein product [Ceratitis capitata]